MIKSTIRDYKAEIIQFVKKLEILPVGTKWENTYSFLEIYDALEKSQPSLMFYGIYNSGKSSLLNSIFGEEKASVNDVPETHRVTEYQWNSYTLVDTPGLNGPKEDQRVTLEEIDKHDVIMFVIDDSDNFDSEEITKRIVDILNAKKPCIIVINKKNDSDEDRISNIKAKMQENIEKLHCTSNNYDFVAVNAVSALKARKEGKSVLLEDSNIEVLEYLISKKLKSVEGIQILRSPIDLLVKLCETMRNQFGMEENDEEATRLNHLTEKLYYVKENILQEFNIALQAKLHIYGDQIYQQTVNNSQLVNQEQYEHEIQCLAQTYMRRYEQESQITLEKFQADWKLELKLSAMSPVEEIQVKTFKSEKSKDDLDKLLDELEKIPVLIPVPTPTPIPIPFSALIKAVKVVKEILFGTEQEELPNINELNRQQEEYARKREIALREIRTQVDMAMQQFQNTVQTSFAEQLENTYEVSRKSVQKLLSERTSYNQLLSDKIENIEVIESGLYELKQAITN